MCQKVVKNLSKFCHIGKLSGGEEEEEEEVEDWWLLDQMRATNLVKIDELLGVLRNFSATIQVTRHSTSLPESTNKISN
jgi:hypothetical protein